MFYKKMEDSNKSILIVEGKVHYCFKKTPLLLEKNQLRYSTQSLNLKYCIIFLILCHLLQFLVLMKYGLTWPMYKPISVYTLRGFPCNKSL